MDTKTVVQTIVEQPAIPELEFTATKKVGRPKRIVVSSTPIAQQCKDCGVGYTANLVKYEDGTQNITPPRCDKCQTRHVTNGRVNKAITAFKHIGNLKARLTAEQRTAIINVLGNELKVLMDVYAGNSVSVGGFDINNV